MPESQANPSTTPNILQEAEAAVYGPRQAAYGHPSENFGRTARLWTAYLGERAPHGLTASDVAMMMVLVKMARLMESPEHRDSIVDMAGYTATYARVRGLDA